MGLLKKLIKKSPGAKLLSKSPGVKLASKLGDPLAGAVVGSRASKKSPPNPASDGMQTGGNQPARRQLNAGGTGPQTQAVSRERVGSTTGGSRSGVGRLNQFNRGSRRDSMDER